MSTWKQHADRLREIADEMIRTDDDCDCRDEIDAKNALYEIAAKLDAINDPIPRRANRHPDTCDCTRCS